MSEHFHVNEIAFRRRDISICAKGTPRDDVPYFFDSSAKPRPACARGIWKTFPMNGRPFGPGGSAPLFRALLNASRRKIARAASKTRVLDPGTVSISGCRGCRLSECSVTTHCRLLSIPLANASRKNPSFQLRSSMASAVHGICPHNCGVHTWVSY